MTEEPSPRTPDTVQPYADLSKAPLPTADTLRSRRSLPYQATRFLAFNARIMRLVLKGDH
jgi:hypothetical protein